MLKILEFFGEPLEYGGQEAFMLNMYINFTNKNTHYTFATPFECKNENLISLAEKREDEIIAYNYKFESKSRKLYIKNAAKDLFSKQHFDVVHIQSGSVYTLLAVAKIAKKAGIKKVIVHSHSTGKKNLKYRLIKFISDRQIKRYADLFLACSDLAAEWKFPKDIIENKKYRVINNGIDTKKFCFNEKTRNIYRNQFKLNQELVLLNVGRFAKQKNHEFIVDIAEKLKEKLNTFKIILVGDGELKKHIINEIKTRNLENYFILLEKRNDVAEIMMASDIFILPSLFEGLAVTSIESQATGLQTICSNTITKETSITDLYNVLPIADTEPWVQKILELKNKIILRKKYAKLIAEKGYDAKVSAKILEKLYIS